MLRDFNCFDAQLLSRKSLHLCKKICWIWVEHVRNRLAFAFLILSFWCVQVGRQRQQWVHLQSKMKHLLTVKASLVLQMQKATTSWQEVASSNRRLRSENEDMHQQIERLRHHLQSRGQQQQMEVEEQHQEQHQHQQQQMEVEEQHQQQHQLQSRGQQQHHQERVEVEEQQREVKWPVGEQGERKCLLGYKRDESAAGAAWRNYHERHQDINQRVEWLHRKLSEQQQQQPAQQQQQDEEDWQALLVELFGDEIAPDRIISGHHIAEVACTQQQEQEQQQQQQEQQEQWQPPIAACQEHPELLPIDVAPPAAAAAAPAAAAGMQYLSRPPSPKGSSSALLELRGGTAAAPAHEAELSMHSSRVVDAAIIDLCLPSTVIGFRERAGTAGEHPEAAAFPALAAAGAVSAAGAQLDVLQATYLPTPADASDSYAHNTASAAPHFHPTPQQQLSGEIEHWRLGNMHFPPENPQPLPVAGQQQQQQEEEEQQQRFILPQQCVWQQQLPDLMPLDKPLSIPDLGQHCQSTDSSSPWSLAMPPLVCSTGLHAAAAAPDGTDASDAGYFIAAASDTGYL